MKATEQMIEAACEEAPELERDHVFEIVQAALDAEPATKARLYSWKSVASFSTAISALLTFMLLILSASLSGSWLDPRIWSGAYVPGDTMASSVTNGIWMMEAVLSASPLIFIGLWLLAFGMAAAIRKGRKSLMTARRAA